ncbi:hypothetical protein B9G98_02782 [Wickerhamiella sorbophila]|uniref:Elongator complex protein 6 n=1 Tax=Wickerhamiella sorbophila TaxID=45607 RepID=A0A2T0FJJ1_9ASCO|nr:hypothetical protein B9G98_02782 [Wickerhamiella sorbophila]PRT55162.1 hypothetical protein B9G98_02782 [Wickerhamiella sorbophila]
MLLSDLSFYENGELLGLERSLAVVSDTPQTSSQWLLEWLCDKESLFVSFCRDKPKVAGEFLDLGEDLIRMSGPNFIKPDLKVVLAKIMAFNKRTVVLQYPTLLLMANLTDHAGLLNFIKSLLVKSRVVVAVQLSRPSIESQLPVSQEFTQFVTSLMHQASLILTIRPVPTGRADDITGILHVSAGSRSLGVPEREYMYTIGKHIELQPR